MTPLRILILLLIYSPVLAQVPPAGSVWINEFHYDDDVWDEDQNEFVELAVPTLIANDPAELAKLRLTLYTGSTGQPYDVHSPLLHTAAETYHSLDTFTLGTTQGGHTFVCKNISPLQDYKAGFSVDYDGQVLQFLSYEIAFTAAGAAEGGGPAAGLTSVLIEDTQPAAVMESAKLTPATHAIALSGAGETYGDFTWDGDVLLTRTPCAPNANQTVTSVPAMLADMTLFLAGPYEAGPNAMNTDLNSADLLPLAQPYADPLFDGTDRAYAGTETVAADFFTTHPDIVDWVLLELRTGTGAETVVSTRPAFLKSDGTLVGLTGSGHVAFVGVAQKAYYVVVRHRHHLPIMTPAALSPAGATLTHNFSTAQAQAFGTFPMREVDTTPSTFALRAGDGNADNQTTAFDFVQVWLPANGSPAAYTQADFNMTGFVTAFDFLIGWLPDNGQASQVPE